MKPTPRNKAASMNFDDLPEIQREQSGKRHFAETAPGQALQNSLLRTELEQWKNSNPVRLLDPAKVLRSKWANRHDHSFQDEEFLSLKADIENSGINVQPIKVRPVDGKPGYFEIIFGHRRHHACLELGKPVLALIENVNDAQMFAEMDRENRQRKDLRPYELGLMYHHALQEKLFSSATKMHEATGANLTLIGKALLLANLPDYIIKAFHSPLDLQYRWATPLHKVATEKPERTQEIADAIARSSVKITSKETYERLLDEVSDASVAIDSVTVDFKGLGEQTGHMVFDRRSGQTVVTLRSLSDERRAALEKLIAEFLGV